MGLAGVLFQELLVFVWRFRRMLRFQFVAVGHGFYSPVETNSDCRNRSGWRQRLPLTMRRIKYSVSAGALAPAGISCVGRRLPTVVPGNQNDPTCTCIPNSSVLSGCCGPPRLRAIPLRSRRSQARPSKSNC